jgi:ComF family protein
VAIPLLNLSRDVLRGLVQLVYPGSCLACAVPLPDEPGRFCAACRSALTTDPQPSCPHCGCTVGPFVDTSAGCPECREVNYHFERVLRLGPYDGILRELILRMKQAGGDTLAELLGELWAESAEARLRQVGATAVVPIPLHWRRSLGRGHNQSEALAHALAARLHLPCRPRWLRRVRHTPRQTGQTPAGRRSNMRGAFRARSTPALRGQSILLVDDVLTTGSTAHEAAGALLRAGAARVAVAVLAHSRT